MQKRYIFNFFNISLIYFFCFPSSLAGACTVAGAIRLTNGTENLIVAALVQTKFTENMPDRYIEIYGTPDDSGLQIAIIPPGMSQIFHNCASVERVCESVFWVSSDAEKLTQGLEAKSRKNIAQIYAEKITLDSGDFFIVVRNNALKMSKKFPADLEILQETSKQAGFADSELYSPNDAETIISDFNLQTKTLGKQMASIKVVNRLVEEYIKKVKNYRDWKKIIAKNSTRAGFALIDEILKKLQATEPQYKIAREAYEPMVLRIFNSIQKNFLKIYQKDLHVSPQETLQKLHAGMMRLTLQFAAIFNRTVVKPLAEFSGYVPEGKSLEGSPENDLTGGHQELLQKDWANLIAEATKLWTTAWSEWSAKVKSEKSNNVTQMATELQHKWQEGRDRYGDTIKGLDFWIDELKQIMDHALNAVQSEPEKAGSPPEAKKKTVGV